MYRFWEPIVQTLLEKLEPTGIVEVGAGQGQNTFNLSGFCRDHGARLYVVDPEPKFDIPPCTQTEPQASFRASTARSVEVVSTGIFITRITRIESKSVS